MSPVFGHAPVPPCSVCRRQRVRARRGGHDPVVLCLACDHGSPLAEKALAELSDAQRRSLQL